MKLNIHQTSEENIDAANTNNFYQLVSILSHCPVIDASHVEQFTFLSLKTPHKYNKPFQ